MYKSKRVQEQEQLMFWLKALMFWPKHSLSFETQSTELTLPPTRIPEMALCHSTSWPAEWSCPKLLQCDWRTAIQTCLTARFDLPFCADFLVHCWATLQLWNLYCCCMQSAQRPNEQCRPCGQHADLNHSIQVGLKGSLPSSAAEMGWYWTKRGLCWGRQAPCCLCPAMH